MQLSLCLGLTLLATVGDGVTFGALGQLVFLPLASLVALMTLVPVCQVLWHIYKMSESKII